MRNHQNYAMVPQFSELNPLFEASDILFQPSLVSCSAHLFELVVSVQLSKATLD